MGTSSSQDAEAPDIKVTAYIGKWLGYGACQKEYSFLCDCSNHQSLAHKVSKISVSKEATLEDLISAVFLDLGEPYECYHVTVSDKLELETCVFCSSSRFPLTRYTAIHKEMKITDMGISEAHNRIQIDRRVW